VHNPYPISDQNGSKTIPFGTAAHTYIDYKREYPPNLGSQAALGTRILRLYLVARALWSLSQRMERKGLETRLPPLVDTEM